jgi:hypothetical protein
MHTKKTNAARPQEIERSEGTENKGSQAQRGDTGEANQGSPATPVMKQFSKTAAERGEGGAASPRKDGATR